MEIDEVVDDRNPQEKAKCTGTVSNRTVEFWVLVFSGWLLAHEWVKLLFK